MLRHRRATFSGVLGLAVLAFAASTFAATPTVVSPANQHGWTGSPPGADTRPGATVSFVVDGTAPAGLGAFQLTTNASTTTKAQYMHADDVALSSVNQLGYYTKQNSASFAGGDPSYQLVLCLGGLSGLTCSGFTTMVYEPYQNGTVIPGAWQAWDVDAGQMWSSRTATGGGTCNLTAGGGGAPFYTLAWLKANCPNADVAAYGVNIGSNNPSYNVESDLFDFNGAVYDFEPYEVASAKDQCKDGGWQSVFRADGSAFKNQGDCIQYVNTGK